MSTKCKKVTLDSTKTWYQPKPNRMSQLITWQQKLNKTWLGHVLIYWNPIHPKFKVNLIKVQSTHCNIQSTFSKVLSLKCNMKRPICKEYFAKGNMHSSICKLRLANRTLQSTIWKLFCLLSLTLSLSIFPSPFADEGLQVIYFFVLTIDTFNFFHLSFFFSLFKT